MDHSHHAPADPPPSPPFWRSRYALGLIVFGAIAAYFLLSEHRAHFIGAMPYLLLLSCPLMHVFMHHGHGGHGGPPAADKQAQVPAPHSTDTTGGQP
jgi:hypothetical protein